MDTKPFHYEFDDFIKKDISINRNCNKARNKNICPIEYNEIINEGEKK